MSTATILALAVALSMDALAVAVSFGAQKTKLTARQTFRLSWHFGLFQALMPTVGWFAGVAFRTLIESVDHWIAFGFLAFVGVRMIVESFEKEEDRRNRSDPTRGWSLVMLSVATSIDAMAVGLSLSMLRINILYPAVLIGVTTMAITALGCQTGRLIEKTSRIAHWAERLGGVVLLGIGVRILFSHM